MADLVKKIKIKKQDGTFTDYIPIGAEAQNISTSDGDSVQLKLNKKPYYYNSVADMKTDAKLKIGDMAVTLGYYEANDGGGAKYRVRNINNSDRVDNCNIISLPSGLLICELIKDFYTTPEVYGAIGDGQSHPLSEKYTSLEDAQITYPFATSLDNEIDGLAIQKAINKYTEVRLFEKHYKINTNLVVKSNLRIIGAGGNTKIFSTGCDIFVFNDVTTVEIAHMLLRAGNDYSCVTINGGYWKNNRVHDLIIAGGKFFVTNAYFNNVAKESYGVIYDCSIKNIWMYAGTTYALYFKGIGHFNFIIEELHNGTGSFYLEEGIYHFIDCNFGFRNGTTFIAEKSATNLIMERCNIECDELIDATGIFKIKSAAANFFKCSFFIRLAESNQNFIELSENNSNIRFESCNLTKYSQNQGSLFYHNIYVGTSRVNAIKFINSSSLASEISFQNDLSGVYKSTVRYNYGNDLQYIYQASQLSQIPARTLFIYRDKKLYYKFADNEYYDMDGNAHTFDS